jgi:NAD(P) transhydrogenase subunit alpha
LQPLNLPDSLQSAAAAAEHQSDFTIMLTIFILAVFVGYYVVWKVTPALHSPLMAVTNAISSIIVVGALVAVGLTEMGKSGKIATVAIVLAAVNICGGFLVTQRMLEMFKGKGKKETPK